MLFTKGGSQGKTGVSALKEIPDQTEYISRRAGTSQMDHLNTRHATV